MFSIFQRHSRDHAIRQYHFKLPKALMHRYGKQAHYTPQQVKATVHSQKLNDRYIRYAFVMYCEDSVAQGYDVNLNDLGRPLETILAGGLLGGVLGFFSSGHSSSGSADSTAIDSGAGFSGDAGS